MHKVIPAFLVLGGCLFATSALAAPTALKCAGADMGPHYTYLWVDYEAKTVDVGRADTTTVATPGVKASVSDGEMAWDVASPGGDMYHYKLNRSTGALGITAENYESGDITCKPDAP
jgi:hypothetical protein